eukprot:9290923-Lingulodinium_polyedra.AAC.1
MYIFVPGVGRVRRCYASAPAGAGLAAAVAAAIGGLRASVFQHCCAAVGCQRRSGRRDGS